MYRFLSAILFIFTSSIVANAQPFQVAGIVVNADNNQPMPGASVFINNSSSGTTTNNKGEFLITNISTPSFELVISFVSFETIVVKITPENIHKRFRVQMAVKENELQEVIVGPIDKNGWKNWGRMFTDYFIGLSDNAKQCVIKNPRVLRFRYNKKNNVLRVTSVDKLQIENKALGLLVDYQLEEFVYDGKQRLTTYIGYASFDFMKSKNERKTKRWKENRMEAYAGSLMHFMRAFYSNKTASEGFELRKLIRLHKEDSSTLSMYNSILSGKVTLYDTAKYITQLMKGSGLGSSNPVIYIMGKNLLPADSIRIADTTGNSIRLMFDNHVMVEYKNELEKPEYAQQQGSYRGARQFQHSIIHLMGDTPVNVEKDGSYFEPLDLLTEGYWGWEKMAEFLPIDYEVGE